MDNNNNGRKKRKPSAKNKKVQQENLNLKITLGLLILNTFLIIFSFFTATGIIGNFLRSGLFRFFGYTFFGILVLFEIVLLFVLFKKMKNENIIRFALIFGIFFNYMAIVDLTVNDNKLLPLKIEVAKTLALTGDGSGTIGAVLGYVYSFTIGVVGLYLFTFLLLLFLLLSFLNITFVEFLRIIKLQICKFILKINEKYENYKENRKNSENVENKEIPLEEVPITAHNNTEEIFDNGVIEEVFDDDTLDSFKLFADEEIDSNNEETEEKSKLSDRKILKREKAEDSIEKEKSDDESCEIDIKAEEKVEYKFPPIELLKDEEVKNTESSQSLRLRAQKIEQTLKSFGVTAKVVKINKGPTVTCFELQPAPGVKVNKIVNLADDLSLALASQDIRIEAPIPGKSAIGIEVANSVKENVYLKEIIVSQEYEENLSKMPMALGKTISGESIVSAMDKMPHILIAGATGSGKSVCINTIILSILYKSKPDEVKLILIDPKVVELSIYNGIPHLAIPVVTNPKKASAALNWAVREMERRYELFADNQVRDIKGYNEKQKVKDIEKLPYIVIVVDELSDLMMVSANEVEAHICRLAQMARACGIHLIVATQRPSVDVITGTIKANIPSRISFQVSSQIDSRTILDSSGAETLLGKGDMLFSPSGTSKPIRIQGCFVSDAEVENVVNYIKTKSDEVEYDEEMIENIEQQVSNEVDDEDVDDLFYDAVRIILEEDSASISLLQRKMKIGYARAGRIIDEMETRNIVGKQEGSKSRNVLIGWDYLNNRGANNNEHSE